MHLNLFQMGKHSISARRRQRKNRKLRRKPQQQRQKTESEGVTNTNSVALCVQLSSTKNTTNDEVPHKRHNFDDKMFDEIELWDDIVPERKSSH